MKTEDLSTLKINKLTQKQYDKALQEGRINENELYLTPDNIGANGLPTHPDFNSVFVKDENNLSEFGGTYYNDGIIERETLDGNNYSYYFPEKSGTLATLEDIGTSGGSALDENGNLIFEGYNQGIVFDALTSTPSIYVGNNDTLQIVPLTIFQSQIEISNKDNEFFRTYIDNQEISLVNDDEPSGVAISNDGTIYGYYISDETSSFLISGEQGCTFRYGDSITTINQKGISTTEIELIDYDNPETSGWLKYNGSNEVIEMSNIETQTITIIDGHNSLFGLIYYDGGEEKIVISDLYVPGYASFESEIDAWGGIDFDGNNEIYTNDEQKLVFESDNRPLMKIGNKVSEIATIEDIKPKYELVSESVSFSGASTETLVLSNALDINNIYLLELTHLSLEETIDIQFIVRKENSGTSIKTSSHSMITLFYDTNENLKPIKINYVDFWNTTSNQYTSMSIKIKLAEANSDGVINAKETYSAKIYKLL